jgi:hypothetical protein
MGWMIIPIFNTVERNSLASSYEVRAKSRSSPCNTLYTIEKSGLIVEQSYLADYTAAYDIKEPITDVKAHPDSKPPRTGVLRLVKGST